MLVVAPSCAWWAENKGDVKSVVNTVDDIAQSLCGVFYGDKMNISVQDAVRTFCDTRDKFAPWIDLVLAGAKAGGEAKIGTLKPTPVEDPWAKPVHAPAPVPTIPPPAQSATPPVMPPISSPFGVAPTTAPIAEPPAKGKAGGKGTAK